MTNKYLILVLILTLWLIPVTASAATFDEMLVSHPSKAQPFMGDHKNIKWISHTPDTVPDASTYYGPNAEADDRGQVDEGKMDLDGDKKAETLKAIWGPGVSDHSLKIEVYKDDKKIDEIKPVSGIQPNYKIEDVDKDGRQEIIIWGGLWDFRMDGEDGVTEETSEGHSGLHRYVVATYKFMRGEYYLWDVYTTKKKYEPFCEKQPVRD
jgi:hypothetical protein